MNLDFFFGREKVFPVKSKMERCNKEKPHWFKLFMDDCVRSWTISICNLISITGPVVHLIWICQAKLENYPIFLFLAYISIGFTFCTFVLAPLQFGNGLIFKKPHQEKSGTASVHNINAFDTHLVDTGGLMTPNIRIFVSCMCCIILGAIELYVGYVYRSHFYQLHVVAMICSGLDCFLTTILYVTSINTSIFAYNKRKQLVLILESLQTYFAELEKFRSQSFSLIIKKNFVFFVLQKKKSDNCHPIKL
ncbi:hypothetical protein RFI_17732 [Reticulomyxa filosa]|uniref:Uncharacterized protein n=1 Tax=Reticulomyxa filosa TaxID=46433 RepID=X6N0S3_RETFI|nr:hypothetical protein RFI_17732 [Reticulomyxa filosa]|eukprot:ETO19498.1 hypothetical protein RFI_17732 [Reticulomyxa filosa]